MATYSVLVGDCEELYDIVEDESVQLCINSPPYPACRDYDCEESLFDLRGGQCHHEWIKDLPQIWKDKFIPADSDVEDLEKFKTYHFCARCGCWFGKLGHEPDWDDRNLNVPFDDGEKEHRITIRGYISHLCDKYDKLKSKLKKDGSLVVVIGDKFSSKAAGSGGKGEKSPKVHIKGQENFQTFKPIKLQYKEPEGTQLCIPFHFMFEMQKRGWIIKQVLPWFKPNAFTSSIKSKFNADYEMIIWFVRDAENYKFNTQYEPKKCPHAHSKNATNKHEGYGSALYSGYEYNAEDNPNRIKRATVILDNDPEAIYYNFYEVAGEIGFDHAMELLDKRFVDTITECTERCDYSHFATFPRELIRPFILGCTDEGDLVLDNFCGAGTTALVCVEENRNFTGFDISEKYKQIADERINAEIDIKPAWDAWKAKAAECAANEEKIPPEPRPPKKKAIITEEEGVDE